MDLATAAAGAERLCPVYCGQDGAAGGGGPERFCVKRIELPRDLPCADKRVSLMHSELLFSRRDSGRVTIIAGWDHHFFLTN